MPYLPCCDLKECLVNRKVRFIAYLVEQNKSQDLDLRAMRAVHVDMKDELAKANEVLRELSIVRLKFQQMHKDYKFLKHASLRLQEKLSFANKHRFGSKSQNPVKELFKAEELRSSYLTETVNYLIRFWAELNAYVQDGAFPIDNNTAERGVWSMTTARNNSFHFGSDLGAQMSVTYHSIISIVKLQGCSVWSYLGKSFINIFEGCRYYSSLLPFCIGLE